MCTKRHNDHCLSEQEWKPRNSFNRLYLKTIHTDVRKHKCLQFSPKLEKPISPRSASVELPPQVSLKQLPNSSEWRDFNTLKDILGEENWTQSLICWMGNCRTNLIYRREAFIFKDLPKIKKVVNLASREKA